MSSIKDTLKRVIIPINNEGYNIILSIAFVTILGFLVSEKLGIVLTLFLLLSIYFFRDPNRVINDEEDVIVAPADGIVDAIEEVAPPEELEMDETKKWVRVSIFLSVFNVHLQRCPIKGKVKKLHYREGKFLNVAVDKYSKDNERQSCVIETEDGLEFPVVQIAGLIARRIVCNLTLNQEVNKGDKYGIIRFGSRVDIYLPEGTHPCVKVGQTMIAGESIIGKINK